jgi:D-arabinose 1-dehydrogenase-like Zn-dependent alcohol dehydrogenase
VLSKDRLESRARPESNTSVDFAAFFDSVGMAPVHWLTPHACGLAAQHASARNPRRGLDAFAWKEAVVDKLDLAHELGADMTVNAKTDDPVELLKKQIGGAQGVLVTAVSLKPFEQALGMVRRGGTIVLNGLPPGSIPLPVFDVVLNGITVRGSIVGTRLDLQEALDFASAGKVKATASTDKLENINRVFERMRRGEIEGRVVLDLAA